MEQIVKGCCFIFVALKVLYLMKPGAIPWFDIIDLLFCSVLLYLSIDDENKEYNRLRLIYLEDQHSKLKNAVTWVNRNVF